MTGHSQPPTVLIVDDEPGYIEAYSGWLRDAYSVWTATSGEAALATISDVVDVVLLDRRMPDVHGDEVLAAVRRRGLDVRVAMLTAVEPGVDIVDMPFDDYLVKPVTKKELRETVENLLVRASLSSQFQKCFSLVSKKAALEVSMERAELDESDEYQRLESRLRNIQRDINDGLDVLIERGSVTGAYADIQS